MNFNQSLIFYILTTSNPTMEDVFDHAIQYARDQGKSIFIFEKKTLSENLKELPIDPEFVKSYKWPEQLTSTEHVPPDYISIRTRESTSGFFPADWEDTGNILVTSLEALQLPEEKADDNNYGDYGDDGDGGNIHYDDGDGDGGDIYYDEDFDGNNYNSNDRYSGYGVYDLRDAYQYPSRYFDKSGYPSFDVEEDDYQMFELPSLKYLDNGEIKHHKYPSFDLGDVD